MHGVLDITSPPFFEFWNFLIRENANSEVIVEKAYCDLFASLFSAVWLEASGIFPRTTLPSRTVSRALWNCEDEREYPSPLYVKPLFAPMRVHT